MLKKKENTATDEYEDNYCCDETTVNKNQQKKKNQTLANCHSNRRPTKIARASALEKCGFALQFEYKQEMVRGDKNLVHFQRTE